MKSEHRHELAQNDLSKLIARWRDRIDPHANKILLGMLVVTVAVIAVVLALRTSRASSSAGFTELAAARAAADFETVADEFPGTPAGAWARLRAGEEYLREGVRLSLTDRAASNERLDQAQTAFEKVLKADGVPPEVREKALNGLAICLESLSDGATGTEPAVAAYKRLLDEFPDSRYRRRAEQRIDTLTTGRAQEFYAWFHSQNPKPQERPLPRDFPSQFPWDAAGATDGAPVDAKPDDDASAPLDGFPPPPPTSDRSSAAEVEPARPAGESTGPALPAAPGETDAEPSAEPTVDPAGEPPAGDTSAGPLPAGRGSD